MSNCNSCPSNGECGKEEEKCGIQNNPSNKIKNIIAVMSGKGGVGKSTMSVMLARQLVQRGYSVGILDADITGPSIPRLLHIEEQRAMGTEKLIFPVESSEGIKVMSLNLVVEKEDEAVIWRGPAIVSVVNQFWTGVYWGELDYLIIDMPPGTSDITLTIMQSFPIYELVVVSTPQDMVSMIVKKVVSMAEKMNIKIKGLIENMAYIVCTDCDKKLKVFSNKSSEEHAEYLGLPLLGELPINLELTEAVNEGRAEEYIKDNSLYSLIFEGLY